MVKSNSFHRPIAFQIVCAIVTLATLLYLAGGAQPLIQLILAALTILLPAAATIAKSPVLRQVAPPLRVIVAGVLTVIAAVPWFFLRRLAPWPGAADAVLAVATTSLALRKGHCRDFLEDLKSAIEELGSGLPWIVVPLLFATIWTGYDAPSGDKVCFHGLFSIDFCNLSTCVALLNASPGLPLAQIADTGPFHYHWLYFAFPACLSRSFGWVMPVGNALALCNLFVAWLLVLTVAHLVRISIPAPRHPWVITTVTAVILFAPFIMYTVQLAVTIVKQPWFSLGVRNRFFLSPANSMFAFGNNTFAIVAIVAVGMLLDAWNRTGKIGLPLLGAALLSLVPGYSVTLLFPAALALAMACLVGQIKRPVVCILVAVPIGLLALWLLFRLNILGSPGGESAIKLNIAFDRAQFLKNVAMVMLPLWLLVAYGRISWKRPTFFGLLLVACMVVPSLVYTSGPGTLMSDFSMKTATLLVVVSTPFVARGVARLLSQPLKRQWFAYPLGIVLLLGLVNTGVYAGQFSVSRAIGRSERTQQLSADYCRVLVHLRQHADPHAIIIDAAGFDYIQTLWTPALAERRVLLPSHWYDRVFAVSKTRSWLQARQADFQAWEATGYRDAELSRRFAMWADYLILPAPASVGEPWTPLVRFGKYALYRSQRQSHEPGAACTSEDISLPK
jgi:hypothetical protein